MANMVELIRFLQAEDEAHLASPALFLPAVLASDLHLVPTAP